MKNFILFFLIFLISTSVYSKVSKKNAQYTGDAIVEKDTMINAGEWFLQLNHCEGTYAKTYKKKLAELSWNDFKNFNQGSAKYASGYTVTRCDPKLNAEVIDWYDEILAYIRNELGSDILLNNNKEKTKTTETKKTNDKNTNNDSSIESKLKKLKSLFDQNLITQEEYDAKRKEILDAM